MSQWELLESLGIAIRNIEEYGEQLKHSPKLRETELHKRTEQALGSLFGALQNANLLPNTTTPTTSGASQTTTSIDCPKCQAKLNVKIELT